jgi:hypothetical protein
MMNSNFIFKNLTPDHAERTAPDQNDDRCSCPEVLNKKQFEKSAVKYAETK